MERIDVFTKGRNKRLYLEVGDEASEWIHLVEETRNKFGRWNVVRVGVPRMSLAVALEKLSKPGDYKVSP